MTDVLIRMTEEQEKRIHDLLDLLKEFLFIDKIDKNISSITIKIGSDNSTDKGKPSTYDLGLTVHKLPDVEYYEDRVENGWYDD